MRDSRDDGTGDMFGGGGDRKRKGMKLALDNEHEKWKTLYRTHAQAFLASLPLWQEFQGENLRAYVVKFTGQPHTPEVWGAMFNSVTTPWLAQGRIVWTGNVAAARARKSNKHMFRVYQKVMP